MSIGSNHGSGAHEWKLDTSKFAHQQIQSRYGCVSGSFVDFLVVPRDWVVGVVVENPFTRGRTAAAKTAPDVVGELRTVSRQIVCSRRSWHLLGVERE